MHDQDPHSRQNEQLQQEFIARKQQELAAHFGEYNALNQKSGLQTMLTRIQHELKNHSFQKERSIKIDILGYSGALNSDKIASNDTYDAIRQIVLQYQGVKNLFLTRFLTAPTDPDPRIQKPPSYQIEIMVNHGFRPSDAELRSAQPTPQELQKQREEERDRLIKKLESDQTLDLPLSEVMLTILELEGLNLPDGQFESLRVRDLLTKIHQAVDIYNEDPYNTSTGKTESETPESPALTAALLRLSEAHGNIFQIVQRLRILFQEDRANRRRTLQSTLARVQPRDETTSQSEAEVKQPSALQAPELPLITDAEREKALFVKPLLNLEELQAATEILGDTEQTYLSLLENESTTNLSVIETILGKLDNISQQTGRTVLIEAHRVGYMKKNVEIIRKLIEDPQTKNNKVFQRSEAERLITNTFNLRKRVLSHIG